MNHLKQPPLPGLLDNVEIKPSSSTNLTDYQFEMDSGEISVSSYQLILPGFEDIMGVKSPITKEEINHGRQKRQRRGKVVAVVGGAALHGHLTASDA